MKTLEQEKKKLKSLCRIALQDPLYHRLLYHFFPPSASRWLKFSLCASFCGIHFYKQLGYGILSLNALLTKVLCVWTYGRVRRERNGRREGRKRERKDGGQEVQAVTSLRSVGVGGYLGAPGHTVSWKNDSTYFSHGFVLSHYFPLIFPSYLHLSHLPLPHHISPFPLPSICFGFTWCTKEMSDTVLSSAMIITSHGIDHQGSEG